MESARLPEELRRLIARPDEPGGGAGVDSECRGLIDLPRFERPVSTTVSTSHSTFTLALTLALALALALRALTLALALTTDSGLDPKQEPQEPVDSDDKGNDNDISGDSEAQEAQEAQEARVLADFAAAATCTTLCCAGLVSSIEATMRAHALRIYRRDR